VPAESARHCSIECAPKLIERGARYVQMQHRRRARRREVSLPETPLSDEPFVAQVNLWLDDAVAREPFEDVLRGAGFDLAGYRVRESLYTEYGDNPHGQPRTGPTASARPTSWPSPCWSVPRTSRRRSGSAAGSGGSRP
jgi:hypothetical protein